MTENEVVQRVKDWLIGQGWNVVRINARPGLDIEAERKNSQRWFIEATGQAITNGREDRPNQARCFHEALGQIVQNRQDPGAKYSVALPDISHYRQLWNRAPAAGRCPITSCLFVPPIGDPSECS